jgi:hypothetical protein
MPAAYDYSSASGYSRTRADWAAWPSTTTPITQANLDKLDQAVFDLKATAINVRDYGATGDDSTNDYQAFADAIAAVSNPVTGRGSYLIVPPGTYRIGTPITLNKDRVHILAHGAMLRPTGAFDCLRITGRDCSVSGLWIDGSLNTSGSVGVGITVGYGGADSYQTHISDVQIWDMRGHGLLWEDGPMLVLSNVYIRNCNDGLYFNESYNDNNHGFINAHVVNCRGVGIRIKDNAGTPVNSSNNHVFLDTKIFGCTGSAIVIETLGNSGSLFLELNGAPQLSLTSTSKANAISLNGVNAAYAGISDLGTGNKVEGYTAYDEWSAYRTQSRKFRVRDETNEGSLEIEPTAARTFRVQPQNTGANPVQINFARGTGNVLTCNFDDIIQLNAGPTVSSGTGTPESVVTAPVGSLFLRTDAATSLYVKQTGAGNTGWVAK